MEPQLKRPAWIEIDLSALENNYNFIRRRINKETKIAAVVKANAYGHGALRVAQKIGSITEVKVKSSSLYNYLIDKNLDKLVA
jgi:alanine racemase